MATAGRDLAAKHFLQTLQKTAQTAGAKELVPLAFKIASILN